MTLSLAWANDGGVDWLVLGGLSLDALTYLESRTPEQLARALLVQPSEIVAVDHTAGVLQAMPGRYAVIAAKVRFAPRFPFLAGTSYAMIVADPMIGGDPAVLHIVRPRHLGPPVTEIEGVYPSATVLPRNALRFYIHFSASMSEGLAARNVHLERADTGARIRGAFSPMDFELWDPARQRLTVLLDPARIKQGLAPHREAGYPLQEGTAIVLVVERDYCDAAGLPLVAERRQLYQIGPDLRSRVDPSGWALEVPAAGGCDPLVVRFDRVLDRALLEDCLAVVDRGGIVPGQAHVAPGERSWTFVPAAAWTPGPKGVIVDPVLEDIAGNSLVRVFDRDLHRPDHQPQAVGEVSIPFVIAAG